MPDYMNMHTQTLQVLNLFKQKKVTVPQLKVRYIHPIYNDDPFNIACIKNSNKNVFMITQ